VNLQLVMVDLRAKPFGCFHAQSADPIYQRSEPVASRENVHLMVRVGQKELTTREKPRV
jgi:hypothetical protein